MCVAGDEESNGSTSTASTTYGGEGDIPEIVVTAPRLGLDQALIGSIDWSEVAPLTLIGGLAGIPNGGLAGALTGALAGAATAVESQEGIDLVDLVELKDDMIVIEGLPGAYVPLY